MQVQVRHGLADHVVDEDHRSVRPDTGLHGALQPLSLGEELAHPVGRQVAEQADVDLGHEQRMPVEQRAMVKEGDQPLGLMNDLRLLLAPDDGAERTRGAVFGHCPSSVAGPPSPAPPC
jgi:hypothetical protein